MILRQMLGASLGLNINNNMPAKVINRDTWNSSLNNKTKLLALQCAYGTEYTMCFFLNEHRQTIVFGDVSPSMVKVAFYLTLKFSMLDLDA